MSDRAKDLQPYLDILRERHGPVNYPGASVDAWVADGTLTAAEGKALLQRRLAAAAADFMDFRMIEDLEEDMNRESDR
jgi:hypothetical protein